MAKLTPEYVVSALQARGVPQHVAQGVVMNFRDESGLNTSIQERSPNVHGTRGYGLAQWTGPRRVALEQYAQAQGKSVDDPDVQLDYFMRENQGPEAKAWTQVMSAPTAQDAAVAFVNKWERPAAQHAASRSARYSGDSSALRHVGGAGSGGGNFAPMLGSLNGGGGDTSGGGIDPIAAQLAAGQKQEKRTNVLGNIGAALDASIPSAPGISGGGGGFGNAGNILATIMQNPQALAQALLKRRMV